MTTANRTGFDLFLSHQWRDKAWAEQLADQLEPFACVWMDYRNLRPGDEIQASIDQALGSMDMVAVLWSPHSAASSGVRAEVETARRLERRIVPCFINHDADGRPDPPWPIEWGQPLGVDMHHPATGAALLAEQIVQMTNQRLPEGHRVQGSRAKLLGHLRGYLNYLANYRRLQVVEDQRSFWIDRIVSELSAYIEESGDHGAAQMLLQAARASMGHDREGLEPLVAAMTRVLGRAAPVPPAPSTARLPGDPPDTGVPAWQVPPAPPEDELTARVGAVVPAGAAATWTSLVHRYLASARPALGAMQSYAASVQSPAGRQVTTVLAQYLQNADDLIPDHAGPYGLLDDAWLVLNTAFRLVESGAVPAAAIPVDWRSIIQTDPVVRAILPPAALATLEQYVMQLLHLIAQEVSSYQPWFTPTGAGYAPVMAAGTWEDQMNQALLGTGLSVG